MRMVAVAAVVLLSLAGCDAAAPTSQAATSPSAASAAPSAAALPAVGKCHGGQALGMYDYRPFTLNAVDCSAEHQAEIVHVGVLTSPPENKTRAVFTACDTAARDYVGGDWHDGRLGLGVIVPSTDEWTKGDHEFRCALFEFASDERSSKLRTGTLKDGLRGDRPLALTCLDLRGVPDGKGWYGSIDGFLPIDCAQPHNGEFVGTYTGADVPFPGMDKAADTARKACNAKAAKFLGESQSKYERRTDLYTIMTGGNPERWNLGDRTVRCYTVLDPGVQVSKSLKA